METNGLVANNGAQARSGVPSVVGDAQVEPLFNVGKVIDKLDSLMDRVTENEATCDTVTAACRCAGEINQLLRVMLDARRLQQEEDKIKRAEQRLSGQR